MFTFNELNSSKIAVMDLDFKLNEVGDILDLMGDLGYNHDCSKVIINEGQMPQDFFDLKTRIAGEILQKCINYGFRIAIIGEFSKYNSNSLNDFIKESNKGTAAFFVTDIETALEKLHSLK